MHVGNVLDGNDFVDSDSGVVLVGSDDQFRREAVDYQSQESVVVLDFGCGEVVAFSQVRLDPLVFGDDIDVVLNWGREVEVVAYEII